MTDRKDPPYQVYVDHKFCDHCGAVQTWAVVGPDGLRHSESFTDEDDAEAIANALNDAYEHGRLAVLAGLAQEPPLIDERGDPEDAVNLLHEAAIWIRKLAQSGVDIDARDGRCHWCHGPWVEHNHDCEVPIILAKLFRAARLGQSGTSTQEPT